MTNSDIDPLGPPPEDLETRRLRHRAGLALFADDAPNLMNIGRFELTGQIGAGSQGIVYLARDPRLDRTVALKRLAVTSPRHIDRMRREALALAQVSHDNVVRIFELDEDETGRPFLVMELVEGWPLDEWLAAYKRDWTTVVDVLMEIGNGLSAVHAAGLAHRDVKPRNIVITSDGRAKLVDFGIATIADTTLDSTGIASNTPIMGTPHFMAPEQFEGRADARSDQYSFCLVLLEALRGKRLAASEHDASHTRTSQTPSIPRPSKSSFSLDYPRTAHKRIGRILARGLQQDPEQRYPDMSALLSELMQVRATRHHGRSLAFALATVGAALLVIMLRHQPRPDPCNDLGSAPKAWQGAREAVRAAFEGTGAPVAAHVFEATDSMLSSAESELDERIHSICRGDADAIDRDRALARAIEHRERLLTLVSMLHDVDGPQLLEVPEQVSRSLSHLHLGPQDACELGPPNANIRLTVQRADALAGAARYDEALAAMADALSLAASEPWAPQRASLHLLRGRLALDARRLELARAELESARALAETLDCDGVGAEALALWAKAWLLDPRPDLAVADHASRQAMEKLDGLGDDHGPRRAEALNTRGLLLHKQGHFAEAITAFSRSISVREGLRPPMHLELSDVLLNLGNTQAQSGQPRLAIATLERALSLRERSLWPEHPSLYRIHASLAHRWLAIDHLAEAERAMGLALTLARGLGAEHPRLANLHIAMASILDRRRDFPRALDHATRADAILISVYGDQAIERLGALEAIGQVLVDATQPRRAIEVLEQALALQGAAGGGALDLAIGRGKLAEAHVRADEPDVALRLLDEAQRAFREDPSLQSDSYYPELLFSRGEALLGLQRGSEAIGPLSDAVNTWAQRGDNPERLAMARWLLAQAHCPSTGGREHAEQALDYFQQQSDAAAIARSERISHWLSDGCPPAE